ncbi:MAG: hypothetical protein HY735_01720 [Verrucomicrobia bacterium]|nr:hypothetical protein [Verrucomicrobiota bacterium]
MTVERSLKQVEGVKKVELSPQKAEVTVDPAKVKKGKPIAAQLIAAVEKGGAGRFKAEEAPKPKDAPKGDVKKTALYQCETCGKTYDKTGECCGNPTRKVE